MNCLNIYDKCLDLMFWCRNFYFVEKLATNKEQEANRP